MIPIKAWQSIEKLVKKIIDEFKKRMKNKDRKTEAEIKERKKFLENIKHTFWVVQPSHEKKLQQLYASSNSNKRDRNDWLYLEGVRGMNRTATLGSLDKKLAKRKKTCI